MPRNIESAGGVGSIRFVALIHEELVAAGKALHRLIGISNAKPVDQKAMGAANVEAINLCLVALYHAHQCDGDDATFCVAKAPTKVLAEAMNRRVIPQVKTGGAP